MPRPSRSSRFEYPNEEHRSITLWRRNYFFKF
jgi:hypothetical protein